MGDHLYQITGEFMPDNLIAGNAIPITAKGIKVAAGQGTLKRGALLGTDGNGEYAITGSKETQSSGETIGCDCILADPVDATDTAIVTTAYVTGLFNRSALSLAEGSEINSYETELRKLGIFLKSVQTY